MESIKFVILSVAVATVCGFPSTPSQQQQVSPLVREQVPVNHQNQNIQDTVLTVPLDAADQSVTNHYPYQSTGLVPSSNYHQPSYGTNYGNREVYNRDGSGWSYPYFGINAGIDYVLTAFVGPVFWAFVAVMATFGVCVGLSRFVMGTDIFGGIFQRSKDVVAGARSLDLDNITNLVYQALDTYGKYAAKAARDVYTEDVKG